MAQPVWTLSVDLQTKTATFQSGLSDAAKAARSSFQDIKSEANAMGRDVSYSMMEARHGVMLLGEEFGVHLPRALTTFVAGLGPIGPAMAAAFPFLAIAVGATLLLEHLAKLKEQGEKLTDSQAHFATTVADVFNQWDMKLLEAGIRADELNGDHLGALEKRLQEIDKQSLSELSHSFEELAKASDLTFAQLKTSWYQFGAGSAGAQHALNEFKRNYELLLAQGKDKEASDLLAGTVASAEKVLALQKQAQDNQTTTGTQGTHYGDYTKFEEAKLELKKQNIGFTEKEIAAQQTLVDALQAQVAVEQKAKDLRASQGGTARQETQSKIDTDSDKAARDETQQQKIEADEAEKMWEQHYREAVANLESAERQKIDATKQGSAARLAAIEAAIKDEEAKGLQETGFFRGLLAQRVETIRQMADEQSKLQAEAGKEDAEHTLKMGELQVAAERQSLQTRLSQVLMSGRERLAEEAKIANEEYALQRTALQQEIAALDTHNAEYENKKKALDNKLEELERQHENRIRQMQDQAAQQEYARLTADQQRMAQAYAEGFSKVIMGKESFGKMMQQIDTQIASGMLKNAIMSALALDFGKEKEAAAAARKAYLAGMDLPAPANMIVAPAWAAAAFASVMAFEEGGRVPGTGIGDTVPAMLTPGETVLSKDLTDHLTDMARSGDGGGTHNHFHIAVNHAPVINAMDSDGMERALKKNADVLSRHLHNELRRMNR